MSKRKFIYNGIVLTLVGFAMRGVGLFLGAYVSAAIGAEGMGLQGLSLLRLRQGVRKSGKISAALSALIRYT